MSTTPQVEIPTDMRKMTEQSLEQVRTAINGYLQLFHHGVPSNLTGGSGLTDKVLIHAETNVASAFEFARRLLQVKDPQDLFMLQMEFIRAQMLAMAEQANDLSETAHQGAAGRGENPDKGRPVVLMPPPSTATIHPLSAEIKTACVGKQEFFD